MNNEENPNSYENSINTVVKAWAELKLLMENPDRKSLGITQALLSGRAISREHTQEFSRLIYSMRNDLDELFRETPEELAAADARLVASREVIAEVRAQQIRVSPFQEWINERMAEYIKTNALSEKLLEGDVQCVRFSYNETERAYRSDSNEAQLPVALVDHFGEYGTDGSLPDWLVNQISESSDTYELFDSMETYDSETMHSDIEHDA